MLIHDKGFYNSINTYTNPLICLEHACNGRIASAYTDLSLIMISDERGAPEEGVEEEEGGGGGGSARHLPRIPFVICKLRYTYTSERGKVYRGVSRFRQRSNISRDCKDSPFRRRPPLPGPHRQPGHKSSAPTHPGENATAITPFNLNQSFFNFFYIFINTI